MARVYTSLPYTEKPVAAGNFGTDGRLPIDLIVFHTADGTLPGTLAWFNNPASQVSSNYVLDINGQLYAMLEEYYVPYTNGDLTANRRSITIEVIDNRQPNGSRTDAMYKTAAALTRDICKFYNLPITRATVKGHREVSSSHPQCPGSLDLDRIVREAQPMTGDSPVAKLKELGSIVFGSGTSWQKYVKLKEKGGSYYGI